MKKKLIATLGISALVLSGCSNGVISLQSDEQAVITTYMSDVLLKYDMNTKQKLVSYKQVETAATETETALPEATAMPGESAESEVTTAPEASNDVQQSTETASFDGNYGNGMNVSYESYSIVSDYEDKKDSAYFNLEANEGKKFFVAKFKVANTTDQSQSVEFLKQNIQYVLQVDGNVVSSSVVTMLQNDLGTLNKTFKGNESMEAVLLFEVPENLNIGTANIVVTKDKSTSTIVIK